VAVDDLCKNINQAPDQGKENDQPDPVIGIPAANTMNDTNCLQDHSKDIEWSRKEKHVQAILWLVVLFSKIELGGI
jgi:hypothetical protein